jgi:hypothetical protein
VVGASCTLNISFKHTTGDYLDAELRTRKPQEPVKLTIDYTQLSSNRDIGINLRYMDHVNTCTLWLSIFIKGITGNGGLWNPNKRKSTV